ncbi:MAG TPA: hypothetical protein DD979_15225, partial [Gammaproteobacteria bacterium]|nr:hypothetical protein [Gammaproteobacteria bacterium]
MLGWQGQNSFSDSTEWRDHDRKADSMDTSTQPCCNSSAHNLCVRFSHLPASLILLLVVTWPSLAGAASLSLGYFGRGVVSGTEPFNVTGTCFAPGDDCGDEDARVRSLDLIQYAWSITANDTGSGPDALHAVVLEQTLFPGPGADIEFNRIPTICLAPPQGKGGDNPPSVITANDDGSITLLCNLGRVTDGEQVSFSVPVRPLSTSMNGSTFTTEQKVYGVNQAGDRVVDDVVFTDDTVYEISAAPAFDLLGNERPIYRSYVGQNDLGEGAGREPGYVLYWTADVAADRDRLGKGIETLADGFSFSPGLRFTKRDGVTPYDVPYKIIECAPNSSAWGNSVFGAENLRSGYPLETKVVDSGTCDITGDHRSGYTLTVTGADTAGTRFPTERVNGGSLAAGPYFVASYRLRVWVPLSAIDAEDDVLGNTNGRITISSCLSDFDPLSQSGVSNYGDAHEPGYNGEAMPNGDRSNNCTGPYSLIISTNGYTNTRIVSSVKDNGDLKYSPLVQAFNTGDAMVEPDQAFASYNYVSNNGSEPFENFSTCTVFDKSILRLVDRSRVGATAGTYAFVAERASGGFDASEWRVEYAAIAVSGDDPLDGNGDGQADFNAEHGRYEGDWSEHRALRCDDPVATWVSDPETIGVDNVNAVRVVAIDPAQTSLDSGQSVRKIVPLEVRDAFLGGPYAGEQIPVGTVGAMFSRYRADGYHSNWRNVNYKPSPENTSSDGDRITVTRMRVDLAKSTLVPAASSGVTGSLLAGENAIWQLAPVATSQVGDGNTAINLSVVDTLPARLRYNDSCTTQQDGGVKPDRIEYNTPNVGQTRLTWQLGDVSSLDAPEPIVYCTYTDPLAPGDTVVSNQAYVVADNTLPSQTVEQRLILGQIGNVQAKASASTPFADPGAEQQYQLSWYNFSPSVRVDPPVMINVLPYNGDASGAASRAPGSAFAGTIGLTGEPRLTFSDGSTPGDDEGGIGQLYYSADNPDTINHNPDENTSNWCRFDGVGFVDPSLGRACPSDWRSVAAIKHVGEYTMEIDGHPRQGLVLSYGLRPEGSHAGDRYTNTFGMDSTSLPGNQYVRAQSDTVTIASYSIGDFVFVDHNLNGKYDPASDRPAPDGITVNLYRDGEADPLRSAQTRDGVFLFDSLGQGDYVLRIPASMFA